MNTIQFYLLGVTAMIGAVGDSVAWDIHSTGDPAHLYHAVGYNREVNSNRSWEGYLRIRRVPDLGKTG